MLVKIESVYKRIRQLVSRSEWMIRLLNLPQQQSSSTNAPHIAGNDEQTGVHPAGLVLVQIDGLSRTQLDRALASGKLPFLQRLLSDEHYQCHDLYSGLPSSTPAVQGELFYGVKGIVPAFGFRGKRDGRYDRMYDPVSASRIQNILEKKGSPLLTGGSAYCNIYTGGAAESHFCAASMGWDQVLDDVKKGRWIAVFFLNLPTILRTLALMIIEFFLAVFDSVRGILSGRALFPEFKFIAARVAVSILMRDMITIGASMDIARGLPVIQLNYLGYDEQSHRRGPDSAFAHWTLKGIDRSIHKLWRMMHRYHKRHYELWVYSDHGQEHTIPYAHLTGCSLQESVTTALRDACKSAGPGVADGSNAVCIESTGHHRADLLSRPKSEPDSSLPAASDAPLADTPSTVVVAMGPVGHIYFDKAIENSLVSTVARRLAHDHRVPAALIKHSHDELVAHTSRGSFHLPAQGAELFGADHPYLAEVTEDLQRLCSHEDAGDIVLLGCVYGITPVSFPVENGAHAGAGPVETSAFALMPEDTVLDHRGEAHTRPLTLYRTAMNLLRTGITPATPPKDNNSSGETAPTEPAASVTSDVVSSDRPASREFLRQQSLRVMTYNVHSCIGMDGIASPERIARVISRYKPDVIALQELDVSKERSKRVDQARRIADLLDMKFHFHPALVAENELYGDAILSRLPMRLIKAGSLHQPSSYRNSEIRGALWVELDFYGEKIQLINTHLGLLNRERAVQIEELTGSHWLGHPDCRGAVIFCGDLNAVPGAAVLKPLRNSLKNVSGYTSGKANTAKTFSSRVPIVQIDHIFFSNALKTASVSVPGNALTRVASDHLPLIASLQLDL